jgi:SsrA-binding protein
MAIKKKKPAPSSGKFSPTIANKKARFNFHLLEKLEAGIALLGTEVKSLRQGKASLDEAYCRIRSGELYLIGCTISIYEHGNLANHEPGRPRKLLVHKRELAKIETKLAQKGLTLIPVRIYFNRGLAKVEIALAQGKTHQDKRDKLRDRQADREIRQAIGRRR